jgi:hypothetical protein
MREGVLFLAGSEDDHLLRFPDPTGDLRFLSHLEETSDAKSEGFQGMEIYNRHTDAKDEKSFDDYFRAAMKNPAEWAKLSKREAAYPDEVFAAGTDYWPLFFTRWDQETAAHRFTGIAANDSHQNQIYNGVTFDPYEVAFRNVSTHILSRDLTDPAPFANRFAPAAPTWPTTGSAIPPASPSPPPTTTAFTTWATAPP